MRARVLNQQLRSGRTVVPQEVSLPGIMAEGPSEEEAVKGSEIPVADDTSEGDHKSEGVEHILIRARGLALMTFSQQVKRSRFALCGKRKITTSRSAWMRRRPS